MAEQTEDELLLDIADELYALDLDAFTPARDARVRELKGHGDLPKRVKALKKPSTAAWVVNLLARHEGGQVEQVLAVGAALREAQAAMSADELRQLTRQRRQLTAAVTTQARGLAREHGLKVTEAVAEQVESTLTAAMLDEDCAQAVRSGLLLTSLASTGVDDVDVAGAVALPAALGFTARAREPQETPRPDLRVVPDPDADAKARAAAQEAVDEAAAELEEAEAALTEAAEAVAELEARGLQVQSEIDELKRRLAELDAAYEEVEEELGEAEDARSEAEAAAAAARRAHEAARAALDRLPG